LLPIKRLNYGATIYPLSFSQYIVGRFECSGRSATDISGLPTSCGDLLQLGHTLNGFYPIKQVNRRIVKIVYCDFNQSSVEEVSGFTTENEFSQFRAALHELQMQVTTQLKNSLKNVRYLCALFSQKKVRFFYVNQILKKKNFKNFKLCLYSEILQKIQI